MKGLKTIWSDEDIEYLKLNYPHQWNKELAAHFGLGWRTIVRKARELKLEKAADFRDNIDWVKIGKGPDGTYNKGCEKTWFKPGELHPMKTDPNFYTKNQNVQKEIKKQKRLKVLLQVETDKTIRKNKKIQQELQKFKQTVK